MFEANEISVSIDGRDILRRVSLSLAPGEVVALLGPNGAGKSTLLKAVCGGRKDANPGVFLDGRELIDWNYHELARKRAVLSQHPRFDFPFSAREVAMLGRNPHVNRRESPRDLQIVDEALALVEAGHLGHRSFPTLSGGEQQRVHLARVLAQIWERPANGGRYLFLDEPTSSLDPAHQHLTLETARKMAAAGTGVLVVLHDLNLAARYADRIVVMSEGAVVAEGAPLEVLTAPTIRTVFRIDAYVGRLESDFSIPMIVPTGRSASSRSAAA